MAAKDHSKRNQAELKQVRGISVALPCPQHPVDGLQLASLNNQNKRQYISPCFSL